MTNLMFRDYNDKNPNDNNPLDIHNERLLKAKYHMENMKILKKI